MEVLTMVGLIGRNFIYTLALVGVVSFMGGAAIGYLAGNRLPVNVPAAKRAAYFVFGFVCGSVGLMALAIAWMEHGGVVTIYPPVYALFALLLLIGAMAAAVWREREHAELSD